MRKRITYRWGAVALFAMFVLFVTACDDDNSGSSSEFASVSGTVTFDNTAMWPDSGEVQITIWPQGIWTDFGPVGPPQNPNNPFIVDKQAGQTQFSYTIDGLPEGQYSAIAVGWRHPDENLDPACRSVVLGVYLINQNVASTGLVIPGSPFQGPAPDSVIVSKGELVTSLDIRADFGIIPTYLAVLEQAFGCQF